MNKYVFDNNALVVLCVTFIMTLGVIFKIDNIGQLIQTVLVGLIGFLTGKVTADSPQGGIYAIQNKKGKRRIQSDVSTRDESTQDVKEKRAKTGKTVAGH